MPLINREPARNVLPDLIIPALAVAFAIYYLTTITEVPWISQASAVFVTCLLFLSIAAFAVRTVRRIRKGTEAVHFEHLVSDVPTQVKRIILLAMTVGYVLLLDPLGFTLTTFVFLFCAIILLSSVANWRTAAIVAASCSVAGYVIFIYFFQTRFPKGFIENTIEGILRHGA